MCILHIYWTEQVTPQIVTLYTAKEPQGLHIPSSASSASGDPVGMARGGTLEAFVNEMDAFASAAGAQLGEAPETAETAGVHGCRLTYRTVDGGTVTIPAPAYSLGEVAIAQALYRSAAADGRSERVYTVGSEPPAP